MIFIRENMNQVCTYEFFNIFYQIWCANTFSSLSKPWRQNESLISFSNIYDFFLGHPGQLEPPNTVCEPLLYSHNSLHGPVLIACIPMGKFSSLSHIENPRFLWAFLGLLRACLEQAGTAHGWAWFLLNFSMFFQPWSQPTQWKLTCADRKKNGLAWNSSTGDFSFLPSWRHAWTQGMTIEKIFGFYGHEASALKWGPAAALGKAAVAAAARKEG